MVRLELGKGICLLCTGACFLKNLATVTDMHIYAALCAAQHGLHTCNLLHRKYNKKMPPGQSLMHLSSRIMHKCDFQVFGTSVEIISVSLR